MGRYNLLLALLLLGSACRSIGPGAFLLEVRDLDADGQMVNRVSLGADGTFGLRFTHSMFGGTVEEAFRAQGTEAEPLLVRSEVRAERAGAAEYYARYGNMSGKEGAWVVEVPPLVLERLPLRVDRVGRPALIFEGWELDLLTTVPEGHLVELRASAAGRR